MARKESLFPGQEILLPLLRERLDGWGIGTVCWDFDGTLVDTRAVFNRAMIDVAGLLLFGREWISEQVERNGEKLRQAEEYKESVMDELVWGLRSELGVRPQIMEVVVKLAARVRNLDLGGEEVERAVERVQRIYQGDIPDVFEGAREAVELVNKAGRRSILMTHAEGNWTWLKRLGTGFIGMFEEVVHFSVDAPKSVQWEEQIKRLGTDPKAILVVGDNFGADILVPVLLGARGILITRGGSKVFDAEEAYKVNDEVVLKERVIKVKQTKDIIGAIIQGEHL